MGSVPPKFEEKSFAGFFGRPLRDMWIAGSGVLLSVVLVLVLPGPLWLRVFLGILVAGTGLVIGFGRIDGVWRFEEALINWIGYRSRPRRRIWRRRGEVAEAEEAEWPEMVVPRDQQLGVPPSGLDLGWGMVTVFVMALMGAVTALLGQGGVYDLYDLVPIG